MSAERTSFLRFFDEKAQPRPGVELTEEGWVKDGKRLMVYQTGRSIWFRPFTGGGGEVRPVQHFFLEGEPQPSLQYGAPIYEDELMDVHFPK